MKKLTLKNKKTFFSKIQNGENFEYSSSFLIDEVKELAKRYKFDVIHWTDNVMGVRKINHYNYLDVILPTFFDSLAKETNNPNLKWEYHGGIVSAHGDKFYSYEDYFNENGLSFFHGVAIGLLSYCNPYAKECRHTESGFIPVQEWIVKNKDKFLPIILDCEKKFFNV